MRLRLRRRPRPLLNPRRIGDVVDGEDFKRARGGELVSDVERETGDRGEHVATSLEVYVPLRLPGGSHVDGVMEFYVDYGPTAAAIDRKSTRLNSSHQII